MSNEQTLYESLKSEDDLGAVVRAHIHIEAALTELIESQLVAPEHLQKMDLEYHDRVKLALACGLNERFAGPLNALGTLRNNFAHKLGMKLGANEVNSLYEAFGSEDKDKIQQSYQRTKKRIKDKVPKSFSKLEPKDRFSLIAITLQSIVVLAAGIKADESA